MARKLIVEIVGDSRSLERAFARSERSAKGFNQQMSRQAQSTRASLESFAIGLPAAAGAGALLLGKQFVDASRNAQVILGQTSVAVEDAGLSWNAYATQVQDASQRISKASAFDDEAVMQSFQVFVRGQHDVERSLKLTELAADVARGRYTDLESATQLVNKAAMGQIGALRRAGIQIDSTATSAQALDALQRSYGRSAATYADSAVASSEKLRVAWENLAEQAGGPLSGALATVSDQLTLIVELGQKAAAIKLPQIPIVGGGGGSLGGLAAKAGGVLLLPGMAPIVVTKGIIDRIRGGGGGDFAGTGDTGGGGNFAGGGNADPLAWVRNMLGDINKLILPFAGATVARPGPTTGQRNQWFDAMVGRMLDRTQDIPTLKGQVARLRVIAGIIQQRIAATKDVTRRLTLEDQLAGVFRTIRADQEQIAAEAAATRQAQKARQKQVEENLVGWLELAVDKADLTKTSSDNLRALKKLQKHYQDKIKAEGLTLDLAQKLLDVRKRIRDLRDQSDRELTPRGFQHHDPAALAAMLGLPGNRRAEALLGQMSRGGTLPTRGAQYGGVLITGNVHVHGVQDVSGFENAIRKQARATPHTRRGAR